jgi:hypothetical protein
MNFSQHHPSYLPTSAPDAYIFFTDLDPTLPFLWLLKEIYFQIGVKSSFSLQFNMTLNIFEFFAENFFPEK